jgi:hypothetical protein
LNVFCIKAWGVVGVVGTWEEIGVNSCSWLKDIILDTRILEVRILEIGALEIRILDESIFDNKIFEARVFSILILEINN